MRAIRHLTPRYLKNRLDVELYEKSNPDHPWLTREANNILSSYLLRSDLGLEFGTGRSTIWFAKRLRHLTSVEHDRTWYEKTSCALRQAAIDNVDYLFVPEDGADIGAEGSKYVQVINRFDDQSLDFVLVDGVYRDACALNTLPKIRPGGLLVIDNANWYLPSTSFSPNSRTLEQGPEGPKWKLVDESLSGWRRIWTSSGVTDTALFIKPNHATKA